MSFCKVSCKNLKPLFWALACNAGLTQIAGAVLVPIVGPGIYSYLPFLAATIAMTLSSATLLGNTLCLCCSQSIRDSYVIF